MRENLKKSIFLIGPSGVGKSLIAFELSKKINIPFVDVDEIIKFVEMEKGGVLSPSPESQVQFVENRLALLKLIKRETPLTREEELRQEQLVYELVDLYNYYRKITGGLKQFYFDFAEFEKATREEVTDEQGIYYLNKLSFEVLKKVLGMQDKSFIVSSPASFGWKTKKFCNPKAKVLDWQIEKILSSANTVLLQPGEDYSLRNPAKDRTINDLLLNQINGYYGGAKLEISTNELFFEPENEFLQQRTYLDPREQMKKEKLKNKAEINNICEQIISNIEALQPQNQESIVEEKRER